eukprot:3031851-Amphidinium_carterae.1
MDKTSFLEVMENISGKCGSCCDIVKKNIPLIIALQLCSYTPWSKNNCVTGFNMSQNARPSETM